MLSIRLSRKGKRGLALYSLIITEKGRDPWGKYLEKLGTYNPHTKEAKFSADRINYWISKGAQPTATVNNLLITHGVIKGEKVRASKSLPGKKKQAQLATQTKLKAEAAAKTEAEEKVKAEAEASTAAEAEIKAPAEVEAVENNEASIAVEAPAATEPIVVEPAPAEPIIKE